MPKGEVLELSSENGDLRDTFLDKGANAYIFPDVADNTYRYAVFEFDSIKAGLTELKNSNGWMDYLVLMVIGDDDRPQPLSSPKQVNVNGEVGFEYTFIDSGGSTKIYSRGQIFDTGTKIYLLAFRGNSVDDVTSSSANRFFSSFKLTPNLERQIPERKLKKGDIEFVNKGATPLFELDDANSPSLSADGSRILVIPELGLAEVYDVQTKKKLRSFGVGSRNLSSDQYKYLSSGTLSDDGNSVLLISGVGVEIRNVISGELIIAPGSLFGGGQRFDNARYISSDLRMIAFPSRDEWRPDDSTKRYGIWVSDLKQIDIVGRFGDLEDSLDNWDVPVITPHGELLAATRSNRTHPMRNNTVVWDMKSGRELLSLLFSSFRINLSANGHRLVTNRTFKVEKEKPLNSSQEIDVKRKAKLYRYLDTTNDERIEVWDLFSKRKICELGTEFGDERPRARSVALSPDGKYVVTASQNFILVWEANTGRLLAAQQTESVRNVIFSDNGSVLVASGEGENVCVWHFAEILKRARIIRH